MVHPVTFLLLYRCQYRNNANQSTVADNAPQLTSQKGQRSYGQCTVCMHRLCLASTGTVYKHGPSCFCSGQPPVNSSVVPRVTKSVQDEEISLSQNCSMSQSNSDSTHQRNVKSDIMNVIQFIRCHPLKGI